MTATGQLHVAAAQYPLDPLPTMAAWRKKIDRWVDDGARTGARLLVFPEYGAMELAATAGPEAAADLQSSLAAVADRLTEMDDAFRAAARRTDTFIVAPSGPRRHEGGFVNSSRIITPGGAVGTQDKLVMTPFERAWGISAGNVLRIFRTELGAIAIAICYDSEFPLLVRAQVDAGADLLVVPSCTEWPSGYHRVRNGAAARALENQFPVVTSPTVGLAPWSPAVDRNSGAAGIFVPPDRSLSMTGVVREGAMDAPGWIDGTIDFDALLALRNGGEMRNRSDWMLQPDAAEVANRLRVDVVDLR